MIKYDGMPETDEELESELNEDELIGFIMRKTQGRSLYYEDVKAVLDAQTDYLKAKGFVDSE